MGRSAALILLVAAQAFADCPVEWLNSPTSARPCVEEASQEVVVEEQFTVTAPPLGAMCPLSIGEGGHIIFARLSVWGHQNTVDADTFTGSAILRVVPSNVWPTDGTIDWVVDGSVVETCQTDGVFDDGFETGTIERWSQ